MAAQTGPSTNNAAPSFKRSHLIEIVLPKRSERVRRIAIVGTGQVAVILGATALAGCASCNSPRLPIRPLAPFFGLAITAFNGACQAVGQVCQ